jgi:hypothetical protein
MFTPSNHDPCATLQGEIEGLMRTHPHLVHPGQKQHYNQTQQQHQQMQQQQHMGHMGHGQQAMYDGKLMPSLPHEQAKKHKRSAGGPYLSQQRSFSSSEEDLRSTPEYDGEYTERI